ncbi:NADP-dependent oxidoreductase [Nocardia sp. CDC159]|uniref:NADP-dependent oxidoreductase n=1 Tax=Nocardia pulmonis TaxID=2951408 RepID=A0A9X2EBN2_9NOCA|nr:MULTISPECIES: NADP-dependent oxidoreductase [Nocardia]MCM6777305.1 NADP-dependent oxidoreductase [Nocardia pulmonis]MCM6790190.1 NADP-dependent oxidoreductase [Nocardia sp. CDC159]
MVVREFGGVPEPSEMPTPDAGSGHMLIRLAAAGLTTYDRMLIDGLLADELPHDFPMIPGIDGAGTVSAIGSDVTTFAVGDRVVGTFLAPRVGHGSFAEYTTAPADGTIARIPDGIGTVQAAALPTAGLTAQRLVDAAGLTPGQWVLINCAAGDVGTFTMQLAATAGARVIAVARPEDTDRMIRLGATEVVDYIEAPVVDQLRDRHPHGVDVLFDPVSTPATLIHLSRVVRAGGQVYSTVGAVDVEALRARGLQGCNIEPTGDAAELRRVLQRVVAGDMVVPVDIARPLVELPQILDLDDRSGRAVLVM